MLMEQVEEHICNDDLTIQQHPINLSGVLLLVVRLLSRPLCEDGGADGLADDSRPFYCRRAFPSPQCHLPVYRFLVHTLRVARTTFTIQSLYIHLPSTFGRGC